MKNHFDDYDDYEASRDYVERNKKKKKGFKPERSPSKYDNRNYESERGNYHDEET